MAAFSGSSRMVDQKESEVRALQNCVAGGPVA
jgi:hypothetical protein